MLVQLTVSVKAGALLNIIQKQVNCDVIVNFYFNTI